MQNPEPSIISVAELLKCGQLQIPVYQRPYKWTVKHAGQLLDDIVYFKENGKYRFGTLVLNYDNSKDRYNIVDGQQRTITLMLTAYALKQHNKTTDEAIDNFSLPDWIFSSPVSHENIRQNFKAISIRVADWDEKLIQFFLHGCELIMLHVPNISEAFQFFDAQNSRGKVLEPHDLLKAFHLREMRNAPDESTYVEQWERTPSKHLSELFSDFLYPIKIWATGDNAEKFSKEHLYLFKGVSQDSPPIFPYQHLTLAALEGTRESGKQFPFQLDQNIINGRWFFDFVRHYYQLWSKIRSNDFFNESKFPTAAKIKYTIDSYDGQSRTGDRYVRLLFDCSVAYYYDRFGNFEWERAIRYLFVWCYAIRLKAQSVRWSTINSVVKNDPYVFWRIREGVHPKHLYSQKLTVKISYLSTKTEKVKELYNELIRDYE